ncbi:MAG: hypothetical protein U1A77_25565 [Pirellulales bacterium]
MAGELATRLHSQANVVTEHLPKEIREALGHESMITADDSGLFYAVVGMQVETRFKIHRRISFRFVALVHKAVVDVLIFAVDTESTSMFTTTPHRHDIVLRGLIVSDGMSIQGVDGTSHGVVPDIEWLREPIVEERDGMNITRGHGFRA